MDSVSTIRNIYRSVSDLLDWFYWEISTQDRSVVTNWFSICQIRKQKSSPFDSWHWLRQPVLLELGSSSSRDGLFDCVTRCTAALSVSGLHLLLIFHYYSLPFRPSGGDTKINTKSAS